MKMLTLNSIRDHTNSNKLLLIRYLPTVIFRSDIHFASMNIDLLSSIESHAMAYNMILIGYISIKLFKLHTVIIRR